jgi:hypothetical protein
MLFAVVFVTVVDADIEDVERQISKKKITMRAKNPRRILSEPKMLGYLISVLPSSSVFHRYTVIRYIVTSYNRSSALSRRSQ